MGYNEPLSKQNNPLHRFIFYQSKMCTIEFRLVIATFVYYANIECNCHRGRDTYFFPLTIFINSWQFHGMRLENFKWIWVQAIGLTKSMIA